MTPAPPPSLGTRPDASRSTRLQYRPDLDGLRAVAVLAVIAFHASPRFVPGGFVGVDVFFVISGFLISGIVFDQLTDGTFTFADFYARRVRRIVPALALTRTVEFLSGHNKTVWLLLQVPELDFKVDECAGRPVSLNHRVRTPCAVPKTEVVQRQAAYRRIVDNVLFYVDDNHLSLAGSLFFSNKFTF